jgi:hypothetical protein
MPEYDGTGPLRAGARRGRRLGRCGRLADEAKPVADPYHDCGLGWSHWPRSGGRGRRAPRGGRATAESARPDAALRQQREFLGRRIKALTEELDRVKALLSEYSRGNAQNDG